MNTGVFFAACLAGDLLAGCSPASSSPPPCAGCARWPCSAKAWRSSATSAWPSSTWCCRDAVHISGILADILVIIGYVAWAFLRLNLAGVEFSHLFATSAVLTAVVAISMQDTLGNLLGGLALQMDNSLEIGDWIQMGDVGGRVSDIQWRYTAIVTRNGERVVIPNSHLMKNRYAVVCNKRQAVPQQRRNIAFNVDLSVPPRGSRPPCSRTSGPPASPTSASTRPPCAC
jgi:hypothetical protein